MIKLSFLSNVMIIIIFKTIFHVVSHTNPCENGGIYAPLSNAKHVCICQEKYIGKNCEGTCNTCVIASEWF